MTVFIVTNLPDLHTLKSWVIHVFYLFLSTAHFEKDAQNFYFWT